MIGDTPEPSTNSEPSRLLPATSEPDRRQLHEQELERYKLETEKLRLEVQKLRLESAKLQTEKVRLEVERLRRDASLAPGSMGEGEQGLHPPLDLDQPPSSFEDVVPGSHEVQKLLWRAVHPETRRVYQSAVDSYELFCAIVEEEAYPATSDVLKNWVATQLESSPAPKQGPVIPDTMRLYLDAIRSHHIGRRLSTAAFEEPGLKRFINCDDD